MLTKYSYGHNKKQLPTAKKVDSYISLEIDADFFSTSAQLEKKNTTWFNDEVRHSPKRKSSTGTSREYLSSSVLDSYREGIEITETKHWAAGIVKIYSGEPGHFVSRTFFGDGSDDVSALGEYTFSDMTNFDAVSYILGSHTNTQYLVTDKHSFSTNGVVEPLTIREDVSFSSIYWPEIPHKLRGDLGTGNLSSKRKSDFVLSVDYFEPTRKNLESFLDAVDLIGMENNNISIVIGPTIGYFDTNENTVYPFEDRQLPRGEEINASYTTDLIDVLNDMPLAGTTYIQRKEKSSCVGFVYDNTPNGTDSIAYGGLSH